MMFEQRERRCPSCSAYSITYSRNGFKVRMMSAVRATRSLRFTSLAAYNPAKSPARPDHLSALPPRAPRSIAPCDRGSAPHCRYDLSRVVPPPRPLQRRRSAARVPRRCAAVSVPQLLEARQRRSERQCPYRSSVDRTVPHSFPKAFCEIGRCPAFPWYSRGTFRPPLFPSAQCALFAGHRAEKRGIAGAPSARDGIEIQAGARLDVPNF